MTVPEERDDDAFAGLLGLSPSIVGASAPLEPVDGPVEQSTLPHGFAARAELEARADSGAFPLTRRELRDRERGTEASAPRRSVPTTPSKSRPPKPRRAARSTLRRDAVRASSAPRKKKTIGARLLSFGAAIFAAALAVGMTVPANAFNTGSDETQLSETLAMPAQTAEVDPTLVSFTDRDAWTVTSWAEMLKQRYGNRNFNYTVGSGPVRWPFPYPVPISSGFGDRAAPCRGCSVVHNAIDLVPGAGAAIFAIADGVVVERTTGTTLGNFAMIEHQIDGQTVYSGYAHMQTGSSPLEVGDEVKVGDFVGLVGQTGQATGPHLHLIIAIGSPTNYVDPFTYLKRYAS